jgi:hypothetical protein
MTRKTTAMLGLLAAALGLLAPSGCDSKDDDEENTGGGYLGALMGSLEAGEVTNALGNLRALHEQLMLYSAAHEGKLPASLEALAAWESAARPLIAAPKKTTLRKPLKYIPGQSPQRDAATNVLVYDDRPVYRGKCLVLSLGGGAQTVPQAQLASRLAATRAALGD